MSLSIVFGIFCLISTVPSQGATKIPSPAKQIEYKRCLNLFWDSDLRNLSKPVGVVIREDMSRVVTNCASWKPANVMDVKSVEYDWCLEKADEHLRYDRKLERNDNDQLLSNGLLNYMTFIQDVCKTYKP